MSPDVDPVLQRQRELFLGALGKSPAELAAYLEAVCAGDSGLRAEVELLIRHHTAGSFLESPALQPDGCVTATTVASEPPGTKIGRYKLLQKIGEGGCGIVYMAEQEEPVRRRVALKIIKLGMDTRSVIARFEAERQALALMDHPSIARVYDAGATETGRPYFVMELVRGVKLTDYCDEKNLTTRQRLDLFIQVCQAIQHAHQKGIIHRDIKPSNILVTQNDGVAVPKVIDFGIAKAINDQRLTDKTVFTAFEQFIGTPAYMSPEQAEISSVDIDTRSDIYSLGVLLYELLTGKTPFDAKELLQAGLDAMRRTIREKEPARPSTRVSTLGGDELTTTAKRRGLEPPKLVSTLRGDLDWIAMKCLEKDRSRRYETVNGLAVDIQRHLNNRPVVASPPSHLYQFQKFVRRNKVAVSVACISLVCLIVALAGVSWGFLNERELRAKEHSALVGAQIAATISNARQAYQESRRDDAEKLLDGIPLAAIKPDATHAAVRRSLGWWHALHQGWDKAASNLALLPRLDAPNDRTVWSDFAWRGTVLAAKADRADYETFRQWLLAEHGQTTDPSVAGMVCGVSLLVPADEPTLKKLTKLLDVVRRGAAGSGNERWQKGTLLASGLADYRRGNFTNAIARCELALAPFSSDDDVRWRTTQVQAVLAMSYWQLHREAEARAALASAREVIDNLIVAVADYHTVNNYFWELFAALDGQILFREAALLIEAQPGNDVRSFVCAEYSLGYLYASGWGSKPDFVEATKWYRIAAEHGSFQARNVLSWTLATCYDSRIRNGADAVKFAEQAVTTTSRKDAGILDTLGAAYAEAGQFEKAAATAQEALALNPNSSMRKELESHLRFYESRKPWRE